MKNTYDFPFDQTPEPAEITPEGIMQSSQVSDQELAAILFRDFGEEIALSALERFHDGALARRALLDFLGEAVSSRQKYWGDQPLADWVEGIRERVFRKLDRQRNSQQKQLLEWSANPALDRAAFLSGAERAAQRLRQRWKALQQIPVITLLAILIAWIARQMLQVPKPAPMFEVLPVQTSYPRQTAMLHYILFWVGTLLAIAVLFWLLRRHPAGRLYPLLLGLDAIAVFFAWSMRDRYPFISDANSTMLVFLIPAMFSVLVNVYFWFYRWRWSRRTWLAAGAAVVAWIAILFNPWIDPPRESFLWDEYLYNRMPVLVILIASLAPLLTWLIFSLRGYWRVISILFVGILEAGVLLFLIAIYALNVQYSDTINTSVAIIGYLFPLFISTILGWLVFTGFLRQAESRRGRWFRSGGSLLIFIQLFVAIRSIALTTSFLESTGVFGLIMLCMSVLGLFAGGIASLLRLPGRQKGLSLALLALGLIGLLPAGIVSPGTTDALTASRAERIDRAIRRYHTANGVYPTKLADLSPGFLLLVPRPLTYLTQEWCYVSGGDYYHLGYPSPGNWGPSGETRLKELTGGNLSAGQNPCEKELYEWKTHMW